jgi:cytochrome c peroxidase
MSLDFLTLFRCLSLTGLLLLAGSMRVAAAVDEESRVRLEVGERLFSDVTLSADGTVSCASCHRPDYAFSDPRARSRGVHGLEGTRNSPTLRNVEVDSEVFWDGRRPDLRAMVLDPLLNEREHGLASVQDLASRMERSPTYRRALPEAVWRTGPDAVAEAVREALSAYVYSLTSARTRFDEFMAGRPDAMTAQERFGMEVYRTKAGCDRCHSSEAGRFTDRLYHGLGIGLAQGTDLVRLIGRVRAIDSEAERHGLAVSDAKASSLGRFLVTRNIEDIGLFRTPSLRWVGATAPYMHDGSVSSLGEALDRELYYRSAREGVPVVLRPDERDALLAFLKAI